MHVAFAENSLCISAESLLLTQFFNNISSSINGIIKLHAAEDSFITIGDSSTYTLPSVISIAEEALALINA